MHVKYCFRLFNIKKTYKTSGKTVNAVRGNLFSTWYLMYNLYGCDFTNSLLEYYMPQFFLASEIEDKE